ncbi:MAG: zinc ribbon domain-containing protein [Arenicellales bacterium]|nr:zinc ribbon domain-containing protein [Arenicellales bacterium]
MPIYPYICGACGHEYDKLQKVSDNPDRECPECGEESVRRKVTAAAFHLKGTGWYATDFKDKGAKKDKGDGKGEASEGKEDTKAKTEDKKSDGKTTDSTTSSSTGKDSSAKSESTKADSN